MSNYQNSNVAMVSELPDAQSIDNSSMFYVVNGGNGIPTRSEKTTFGAIRSALENSGDDVVHKKTGFLDYEHTLTIPYDMLVSLGWENSEGKQTGPGIRLPYAAKVQIPSIATNIRINDTRFFGGTITTDASDNDSSYLYLSKNSPKTSLTYDEGSTIGFGKIDAVGDGYESDYGQYGTTVNRRFINRTIDFDFPSDTRLYGCNPISRFLYNIYGFYTQSNFTIPKIRITPYASDQNVKDNCLEINGRLWDFDRNEGGMLIDKYKQDGLLDGYVEDLEIRKVEDEVTFPLVNDSTSRTRVRYFLDIRGVKPGVVIVIPQFFQFLTTSQERTVYMNQMFSRNFCHTWKKFDESVFLPYLSSDGYGNSPLLSSIDNNDGYVCWRPQCNAAGSSFGQVSELYGFGGNVDSAPLASYIYDLIDNTNGTMQYMSSPTDAGDKVFRRFPTENVNGDHVINSIDEIPVTIHMFKGFELNSEYFEPWDGQSVSKTSTTLFTFSDFSRRRKNVEGAIENEDVENAATGKGISSIGKVDIGTNVQEISGETFLSCTGLSSVTIPSTVGEIGTSAFFDCPELTSIVLYPEEVGIGTHAFGTSGGTVSENRRYFIPNGNLSNAIKDSFGGGNGPSDKQFVLFADATFVKRTDDLLPRPYDISSIDPSDTSMFGIGRFQLSVGNKVSCVPSFENSGITDIFMGDSVISVASNTFNKSKLRSVHLGNGLNRISKNMFADTPLTGIEIPNSVTAIGQYAFYNCANLREIAIPDSVVNLSSPDAVYMFRNCTNLTSIYIGDGVSGAYGLNNFVFTNTKIKRANIREMYRYLADNIPRDTLTNLSIRHGTLSSYFPLNRFYNLSSIFFGDEFECFWSQSLIYNYVNGGPTYNNPCNFLRRIVIKNKDVVFPSWGAAAYNQSYPDRESYQSIYNDLSVYVPDNNTKQGFYNFFNGFSYYPDGDPYNRLSIDNIYVVGEDVSDWPED